MKKIITILFACMCCSISYAQNVGIGTNNPLTRLHVTDSSVLFSATGDIPATPGYLPIHGVGRRFLWYADKAAFRVGYVNGNYWDKDSIGNYSFAQGVNTQANGNYAVALGADTYAKGDASTALGEFNNTYTEASTSIGEFNNSYGFGSTTIGFSNNSYGRFSVAANEGSYAKARSSTVIGTYNDISDNPDANTSAATDRIFQIGNGNTSLARANAVTVLHNGNFGIGTTVPVCRLQVLDSSVLFSSTSDVASTPAKPPVSGTGKRMMWYADKAAFRVGYVNDVYWDKDSIGNYSFAQGVNTQATGNYSVAMGADNLTRGDASTAFGEFNNTYAEGATSVGEFNNNYGFISTTIGFDNKSYGRFCVAANEGSYAKARASTTIGSYNDLSDNPDANTIAATDRIFQIGNGNSALARTNAVTVLRNGNFGLGTINPQYILDVNGRARLGYNGSSNTAGIWYNNSSNVEDIFAGMNTDTQWGIYGAGWKFTFDISTGEAYKASGSSSWIITSDERLKKDVSSYTDGLKQLMQIKPVWFTYKEGYGLNTSKAYVGVLAQEMQKIAPYMVGNFEKDGAQYLNLDNSAMTYMLINSVKEQQTEIQKQQEEIDLLKEEVELLKHKNK
jgi:hypothetical protein